MKNSTEEVPHVVTQTQDDEEQLPVVDPSEYLFLGYITFLLWSDLASPKDRLAIFSNSGSDSRNQHMSRSQKKEGKYHFQRLRKIF